MANEAVLLIETSPQIPFTVANGTGIAKGAILKLTDPMTAIINSGVGDQVAGIAGSEKIASDGTTQLGVYRGGIFKVKLSGSCTVGDPLETYSNANVVQRVAAQASGSHILGIALETGVDADTIKMELRPMSPLGRL